MPSSPTSPHWYEAEHLERLIGALTHDLQNGNHNGRGRTVREFVSEFRSLTSTIKQEAVLAELGLCRAPLSALIEGRDFDHERVARLLAVMKAQAKPVGATKLGTIGRAHLAARFERLGIREGSFEDDGFGWPQRDGLKWLHFALVDVLVGVWRMRAAEVAWSRRP